jgi:hypothetical protein
MGGQQPMALAAVANAPEGSKYGMNAPEASKYGM